MLFCLLEGVREGVVWCRLVLLEGVVWCVRRCCLMLCCFACWSVVWCQEVLFGCLGLLEVVGWSVCVMSLLFGDGLLVW